MIYGYIRVSSDKQTTENQGLTEHHAGLKNIFNKALAIC